MKRPRDGWIWALLGLCAILVFGAMTWFTRSMLATEYERATAEARADLQERMRLSLWRMDTLGASILLNESQRPVGVAVSQLAVKTRFSIVAGQLQEVSDPALSDELRKTLFPENDSSAGWRAIIRNPIEVSQPEPAQETTYLPQGRFDLKDQNFANVVEQNRRSKAVDDTLGRSTIAPIAGADSLAADTMAIPPAEAQEQKSDPAAGIPAQEQFQSQTAAAPKPVLEAGPPDVGWIKGDLFLIRRVFRNPGENYEGAWVDVPALQKLLLAQTRDLLPQARLFPASMISEDGLVLASFPFRLEPGGSGPPVRISSLPLEIRRNTLFSLAVGWFAALLAMATAALLMRGVMRLSERRASFVSAVTHELRTPLTTFRLYSDMLESGAVKEEKRGQYLRVLSREADRLAHLVENVLAFSRIERGSARSVISTTGVADLLEPMRERFEARLAAAGLLLEMDLTAAPATPWRVDATAIEHILFNLIDNAAKYASAGNPPVVSIVVSPGKSLTIRVADHGPGISRGETKRIFRAFHKSARDAAESRPGVGLGLALSRRLAREMGGDLHYEPAASGACFVLTLLK